MSKVIKCTSVLAPLERVNIIGSKEIIDWNFEAHLKSRPIPVQAWTGPEGSCTLRLPDLKKQSAYEGGKVVSPTHRPPLPPPPQDGFLVVTLLEAESTPGS
jgi:hypothetical protein